MTFRQFFADSWSRTSLRVAVWSAVLILFGSLVLARVLEGPVRLVLVAIGASGLLVPLVVATVIGLRLARHRGRIVTSGPEVARSRGLTFATTQPDRPYSAAPFRTGNNLRDFRRMSSDDGRLEVGSLTADYWEKSHLRARSWSYVRHALPRPMPHILIDSRANDVGAGASMPLDLARTQVLLPEGDFPRRFRVYSPIGYGADALYVLTPDVMACLLDYAADFDVEIVDTEVFVYSSGQWDLSDASMWERVAPILDRLIPLLIRRSQRYADERTAPDRLSLVSDTESPEVLRVARAGRRLKGRDYRLRNVFATVTGVAIIALSVVGAILTRSGG